MIVSETEVDVLLEFPSFLCDPANVGNLISGSSSFPQLKLYLLTHLKNYFLDVAEDIKDSILILREETEDYSARS